MANSTSEFIILNQCRYWLNKFGLHAQSKVTTFGPIQVPNRLVNLIYSMPMGISVVLSLWYIIENQFDLSASSVATVIIFGGGQIQMIYLIMAANSTNLFELIDQLQNLVNKRKFFFHSFVINTFTKFQIFRTLKIFRFEDYGDFGAFLS